MSANVEETEMTTQTDAANSGQTVLVHAEIGADGALRPIVAELLGARREGQRHAVLEHGLGEIEHVVDRDRKSVV